MHVLTRKTLDQMYKALVRSHLDYCDIIYHIPSVQTQFGVILTDLMGKAERIQYQAALAVTGAWKGSSRSKLYEELGWESLSERRWCRCILQLHKIVSNNTPYLKDKPPRHRRPLYSQNNNNTFHEIKCRSSRYMSSFFPDVISSWNSIIAHFDNIPSINILRDHILSLIRPKKTNIFGIHDPLVESGPKFLKISQKRHNYFIDTPSDKCLCNNDIEDTNHFIISFPFLRSSKSNPSEQCNTNSTKIQPKSFRKPITPVSMW